MILFSIFLFFSASELYSQSSGLGFLNRILGENNSSVSKSRQRLVTGRLLTTDDPAAIAIYSRMEAHVRFLSTNIRNQNDLILYYQARDGYLTTMVDSLQRIRELTLQKSNGFYGPFEQDIFNSEISMHYDSIIKNITRAQFNTKPLFAEWMDEELIQNHFKKDDFYTTAGVDRILTNVVKERSRQGAIINALRHRVRGEEIQKENTVKSYSQGDTDFAAEITNLQKSEILFFSNLFLLKMHVK